VYSLRDDPEPILSADRYSVKGTFSGTRGFTTLSDGPAKKVSNKGDLVMKQSRIVIAAAAAAVGVLFTAPAVATATPLTPIGSQALITVTQNATAIDKAAVRHRVIRRGGWRHGWGWRRGCWNCGWGWRRHWGGPFYYSYGDPYYGYPYGYPYYGYGWGPGIGFGFRIH
jgi:hypothetical protein